MLFLVKKMSDPPYALNAMVITSLFCYSIVNHKLKTDEHGHRCFYLLVVVLF